MSLDYEPGYHLRCRLLLQSGRRVHLEALHQWMTYAGWLEGVPWAEFNDRAIAIATEQAEALGVRGLAPYVLAAGRRAFLRKPGDMANIHAIGGRVAEWLPMVTCVGVFKDTSPARDKTKDHSYLKVLWYQDDFALPIEDVVFQQMRSLDWDALAWDTEI